MPALTEASPVSFILPAPPIRRYISTYYFLDTGAIETIQEDFLYPEWGTVRFCLRGSATGNIVGLDPLIIPADSVTGPTGKAALIRFQNVRIVGFGILPLGWHRLIGYPADRWADKVCAIEAGNRRGHRPGADCGAV